MAFDPSKVLSKFIGACNPDPSKAGKTLLVLNALGMLFAAASDTFAAAIDKNTPAEEKKFLVPAGVATGAAKIGLYYLMTNKIIKSLKASAESVVENMGTEELTRNAKDFALNQVKKAETGFMGTGLFKKSAEHVASMKNTLFADGNIKGIITEKAKKLYKDNTIAAGGVLGAFIGAVVGCALITPIIRDVSAYFVQKGIDKAKAKKAGNLEETPYYKPYFVTHHGVIGGQKQPLSLKNYISSVSGNLRV